MAYRLLCPAETSVKAAASSTDDRFPLRFLDPDDQGPKQGHREQGQQPLDAFGSGQMGFFQIKAPAFQKSEGGFNVVVLITK